MKYSIRENSDGTHTLMRFDEPAAIATPSNAEYEFWVELERLREEIKRITVDPELPLPSKKELMEMFAEAALPLQKWMRENFHPHTKALIDSHRAELYEVMVAYNTEWKKDRG